MNENKIQAADGVRGFALMIVVVMHATGLFFPSLHDRLGGTAQPGVWLFFVLSSFLLTHKFLNGGFSFLKIASYFLGRFIRIIPIFYISAAVYFLVGLFDFSKLMEIVTFYGTYIHFWTIPVEFKFYFILPIIAYTAMHLKKMFGVAISLVFLMLVCVAVSLCFPFTDRNLNGHMSVYVPVFMYGIIAAFVYNFISVKINKIIADALSLLIIFSFVLMTPPFMGINGWLGDKFVILGPAIAFFVYLQVVSNGVVQKFFSMKWVANLGRFSFSIYLFHIMIIFMIYPSFQNNIAAYLFTIFLCIGGGVVSYYLIESPLEKMRHSIMGWVTNNRQDKDMEVAK